MKWHEFEEKNRAFPLFWRESGRLESKELLCLVHGFPDRPTTWGPLGVFLSKYHLLAPYNPGVKSKQFKWFSGAGGQFNREVFAKEIAWILERYSEKKIIFVAHDLGGVIADFIVRAGLLEKNNQSAERIFFINSLGLEQFSQRYFSPTQWLRSCYMFAFQLPIVPQALMQMAPFNIQDSMYRIGGLKARVIRQIEEGTGGLNALEFYRQHLLCLIKGQTLQGKAIATPAHFIWGRDDLFLEGPSQNERGKFFQSSTLDTIKANHWPQVECPQLLANVMENYL